MLDVIGAVYSRLSTDSALMSSLRPYGPGRALVSDPPPADLVVDSPEPVVIISGPADDEARDTYSEDYRDVVVRVRLYHRPDGSTLKLDTAAERVRSRLKGWPPGAVTGGKLINAAVSGPVAGPTDDPAIDGRIVTARLLFQQL